MKWSYELAAFDPLAGSYVTDFAVSTPGGAEFDETTNTIHWTPTTAWKDTNARFEVSFVDANEVTVRQVFDLPVLSLNSWEPTFSSIPCLVAPAGKTWVYDVNLTELEWHHECMGNILEKSTHRRLGRRIGTGSG